MLDDVLERTMRNSSMIELFDGFMGYAAQNEGDHFDKWFHSIQYCLEIWDDCRSEPTTMGDVFIYTMLPHKTHPQRDQRKIRTNSNCIEGLIVDLLEPLRSAWVGKMNIKVIVTKNDDQVFHKRWIRSNSRVVRFDPGLDFIIDDDGTKKVTPNWCPSRGSEDHRKLEQIKQMKLFDLDQMDPEKYKNLYLR